MKKVRKYLHQNESESLAKKLAAYSAAVAGSLALAPAAQAQVVVFTPQYPDSATVMQTGANADGAQANFDIDGDGIVDVSLYIHTGVSSSVNYGVLLASLPSGNGLLGYTYNVGGSGTYIALPYTLSLGDSIGSAGQYFSTTYSKQYLGLAESTGTVLGDWTNATSQFLGIYFLSSIDGQMHYGWMRMTTIVSSDTALVTFIQGVAYDTIPNQPIVAGYTGVADSARDIVPYSVGTNNNGSDLLVTFHKAPYEYTVSSYRIMVVKTSEAGAFNQVAAEKVLSANYTAVTPNGQNISQVLASGANDVDGNPIHDGVPYSIFVLNMADTLYADSNSLSGPSSGIYADTSSNIEATAIGFTGNGASLQVTFNKASNESTVSAYRILVVPTSDSTFNLASANSVVAGNYTSITPNGSSGYGDTLSVSATDVNGNLLATNQPYVVYVLNVADGTDATVNSLSGPSNIVTLIEPADTASDIVATQVGTNDNGSAMQVSFNKAANESTVSIYRIIVVKESEASSFNLSSAQAVVFPNYTAVLPDGSNIAQVLSDTATDADGAAIHDSVAYQVFVLNEASDIATGNTLSGPSAPITLSTTGIASIDELQNVDMYSFVNSIYLHFNNASNTNGLLQVYNTLGQEVYIGQVSGDQKIALNALEGVYVVSLTQDNKVLRKLLYISN